MSKRGRLLVVVLVLIVSGIFLYPTFEWYFMVPQGEKELAAGSKIQIREYARGQAAKELEQLKEMVEKDPDQEITGEYQHLIDTAEEQYEIDGKKLPDRWTVEAVLLAFDSEADAFEALEAKHRMMLLDRKDQGSSVLQLGLDLSGGMRILLEADLDRAETGRRDRVAG